MLLDPNLLPYVRMMLAGIVCIPILWGIVSFAQLWIEARREYGAKRYRSSSS